MNARYLALGDSYTIGERVLPNERWPTQLAAALRAQGAPLADVEIVARTGWTTDQLAAGIDAAKPAGPYGLVSLQIGVNNQFRGRTTVEYDAEFHALLLRAIALAGGAPRRVLVVSIPDWGVTPFANGRDRHRVAVEIDAFNAVNRARARDAGAPYVDVTPVSRRAATDVSLIAADGLHPSAKMYAMWLPLLLPLAAEALAER